jgi:putative ABC transport system permease protein
MKLNWTQRFRKLIISLKLGLFLAVREIKRANKWATALIATVMLLTFLNLVVVSGVLIGLIEGAVEANRIHYTSDVLITPFKNQSYVTQSTKIVQYLENIPDIEAFSARYVEPATIEANYKDSRRPNELVNSAGGLLVGIDPDSEHAVSDLGNKIAEGEYLEYGDYDEVMLGSYLLDKYLPIDTPGLTTLRDVEAGSKVRLKVGDVSREVIVKGVVKSKVDELDLRIYMIDSQLRALIGRNDFNIDEISIKLKNPEEAAQLVTLLKAQGFDKLARIQTWQDAQPKFLKDIADTFGLLGNVIGSIGLVVASITIFIVIFVNAITRRRYIGILKGIGISSTAIEFSYILQAVFYAGVGILAGLITVYGVLIPYFNAYPINFPFSDGILVVTNIGIVTRVAVLMIATIIAGYIPARIVVRQNTLDAILGR